MCVSSLSSSRLSGFAAERGVNFEGFASLCVFVIEIWRFTCETVFACASVGVCFDVAFVAAAAAAPIVVVGCSCCWR